MAQIYTGNFLPTKSKLLKFVKMRIGEGLRRYLSPRIAAVIREKFKVNTHHNGVSVVR